MRRVLLPVTLALALVVIGVVGVVVLRHLGGGEPGCDAAVSGRTASLDLEQGASAGMLAGISVGEDLPARAATVALVVAMTEDDLRDLPGGAETWAREFYPRLTDVDGYRQMDVRQAAAAVTGRDADDFSEHEDDARTLASALTGQSDASFTCDTQADFPSDTAELNQDGLTPRAQTVLDDVRDVFGDLPVGGFAPEGVSTGHIPGSAHYEGRAVDIFFRPITQANQRHGWAVASYLVSQTDRLAVATVIFDDRIWSSASRSDEGWRDYDAPDGPGDPAILEHRDHVHVDVAP